MKLEQRIRKLEKRPDSRSAVQAIWVGYAHPGGRDVLSSIIFTGTGIQLEREDDEAEKCFVNRAAQQFQELTGRQLDGVEAQQKDRNHGN